MSNWLQKLAVALLALDATRLDRSVAQGELTEICNEEEPTTQ
jgi:hypothetical protein